MDMSKIFKKCYKLEGNKKYIYIEKINKSSTLSLEQKLIFRSSCLYKNFLKIFVFSPFNVVSFE